MTTPISRTNYVLQDEKKGEGAVQTDQPARVLEPTPENLSSWGFKLACGRVKNFFQLCATEGEFGQFLFIDLNKSVADFLIDFASELNFDKKDQFEEGVRSGKPLGTVSSELGLNDCVIAKLLFAWKMSKRTGVEHLDAIKLGKAILDLFQNLDSVRNFSLERVLLEGLRNEKNLVAEVSARLKKLGLWTTDQGPKTVIEAVGTTVFKVLQAMREKEVKTQSNGRKVVVTLLAERVFTFKKNKYDSVLDAFEAMDPPPFNKEELLPFSEIDSLLLILGRGIHTRLSLEKLAQISTPLEAPTPLMPMDADTLNSFYDLFSSVLNLTCQNLQRFADNILDEQNKTIKNVLELLPPDQLRQHKKRVKLSTNLHAYKPFERLHMSFLKLQDLLLKRKPSIDRSVKELKKNPDKLPLVNYELINFFQAIFAQFKDLTSELENMKKDIDTVIDAGRYVQKRRADRGGVASMTMEFEPSIGFNQRETLKENAQQYGNTIHAISDTTFVLEQTIEKLAANPIQRVEVELSELVELSDRIFDNETPPPSPLVKKGEDEKSVDLDDLDELVPPSKAAQQLPQVQKKAVEGLVHLQKRLASESPVIIDAITPYILDLEASLKKNLCPSHLDSENRKLIEGKAHEICSHLFMATQGFELFVDAALQGRWELLELFYQNFMIDALAAIEQRLSLEILATTGTITDTHSLLDLARSAKKALSDQEKDFLTKYNKSFVSLRYEEYYRKKITTLTKLRQAPTPELFLEIAQDFLTAFKLTNQKLDPEFLGCFKQLEALLKNGKRPSELQEPLKSSVYSKLKDPLAKKLARCPGSALIENIDPVLPIRQLHRYLELMHLAEHAHSMYPQESLSFWFIRMKLHQDKLFKQLFTSEALVEDLGWMQSHKLRHYTEILKLDPALKPEQLECLNGINLGIGHHYLHTVYSPLRNECLQLLEASQLKARGAIQPDFEEVGEKEVMLASQKAAKTVLSLLDASLIIFKELLPKTVKKVLDRAPVQGMIAV